MAKYAQDTSVSPERSMEELRQTITRFGASQFAFMMTDKGVAAAFEMKERRVRFYVPLPALAEFAKTPSRQQRRSAAEQQKVWDQAIRQRYRALLLVIKAKLEAVESGIETFDEAFLAHLVLPDGQTVGEWYKPQIEQIYNQGMPPLLPAYTEQKGNENEPKD